MYFVCSDFKCFICKPLWARFLILGERYIKINYYYYYRMHEMERQADRRMCRQTEKQ